ncbi:MAG TPA: tetratricopeptide repeat protein [Deltaproteobacteria bacterium]|nr:tetratricopeptide repeat protein [Deltaproteobacteria bacterium]
MSTPRQSAWLFGPLPDLMLGAGLLYLLFLAGLIAWGPAARAGIPASWIACLVLVVSGSHYGGTLLRVYEHGSERRTYRLFTTWGTAFWLLVLVAALHLPLLGSLLITLYLTWSPWHYTGQNYGIAVMFLRRQGVAITPAARRMLRASFVLSFLTVFLTMHFDGSTSPADPLGYRSLDGEGYRFLSLGLPTVWRSILMPIVGLGYLVSSTVAATLLVRTGGLRSFGPTALLMLTQAVWFSIPYLATTLGLSAKIPALEPTDTTSYQFYFVWVALGHAIQYLWITAYHARAHPDWRGFGRYFSKVFVFGNAVWAAPVLLLGPDLLGRPDYDFGLAMCVAAAVNLHHFMLDGAIWKLRNPRLARVLLSRVQPQTGAAATERSIHPRRTWIGRLAWSLAGLFCLVRIVPYIELDGRFPEALRTNDLAKAEAILDRAALYGRDSAILRSRLANRLLESGRSARAFRDYWRSLRLHPNPEGFAKLGTLSKRRQGPDQAIHTWKKGLELFPDDFELNRRVGLGLMEQRRWHEAIPHLERALTVRPEDKSLRDALARALNSARPKPVSTRPSAPS